MRAIYVALLGALFATATSDLKASQIAFDTAGDSAYNNMPASPAVYPNGGYGWGGPWQSSGLFINTPGLTGPGGPQDTTLINSPATPGGRAWGLPFVLYNGAWAARPFAEALTLGQTFSMDVETRDTSTPYGPIGQDIVINGTTPFNANGITVEAYSGAYPDYRVYVQQSQAQYALYATGVPLTDEAIHIDVSLVGNSLVRLSITSLSSDALSSSLTFADAVPMSEVALNEGGGSYYLPSAELFFNNMAITPEPASLFALSLGIAAMMLKRRRRAP